MNGKLLWYFVCLHSVGHLINAMKSDCIIFYYGVHKSVAVWMDKMFERYTL
jgi:hypothetical protein